MLVSIITVTYNSATTLAETMRSVEEQDYPDIEHIIVDGLSTDNTVNIAQRYPHTAQIISERDEGIYDAMNKGINAAKGEIIGILNSDDIYVDQKVISRIAHEFKNPAVQSCYADLQYIDAEDNSSIKRTWRSGNYHA